MSENAEFNPEEILVLKKSIEEANRLGAKWYSMEESIEYFRKLDAGEIVDDDEFEDDWLYSFPENETFWEEAK